VHGAILSDCPSASIVDLTHAVAPQDVFGGAFLLWTAVSAFPAGSVHVAVVDPGVGSSRRAIALQSRRGDALVGPDNGVLWPDLERLGGLARAISLPTPARATTTFHGRDIFAPAAARLACGEPLETLGQPIHDPLQFVFPSPEGTTGEVLHVDIYGNLVTNLPAEQLAPIRIGSHVARPVSFYAEVAPGELLSIVGSAGLVEISVRDGNAAALTRARRGTPLALVG
jgi:S-adenosylmethionine hydrolase